MNEFYKCPICNSLINLEKCSNCGHLIKYENNIYHFIVNEVKTSLFDFDKVSEHYYRNDLRILDDTLNLTEKIKQIVNDGIILDVGCGDGFLTVPLLKQGAKVIALDNSIEMLNRLNLKLKVNDTLSNNLRIIYADATKIPILNEKIDLVIANNIFHLLAYPNKVFNEIYRVLKMGGKFIQITDSINSTYHESGKYLQIYKEITEKFLNKYKNELKKYNLYPNKYKNTFNVSLEANKLYSKHDITTTQITSYRYNKNLYEDFFKRILYQVDYAYSQIPKDIHENIYNKVYDEIKVEFNVDLKDINYTYFGEVQNIIDIYVK